MLFAIALLASACGGGAGAKPAPSASSPTPTPSLGPRPGGTLRIAGVTRVLNLDPAAPVNEQTLAPGQSAVSTAQADELVGRLLLRQLYTYPTVDPTAASAASASPAPAASSTDAAANGTTSSGPVPDLAAGQPKISDDGRLATIRMRAVRWDVSSGRRVTANDELRALKRLCLPQINSPVRGYFEESVVGYAAACRDIAHDPPATLSQLDAVRIPGLTTQGDTTLLIRLIRPTNDLTDILSLPETSPLPIESFVGIAVTNDPLQFVGDGPYAFVTPHAGETYALSRNPTWSPGSDPLRHAYVDHISIRGGMTPATVIQQVQSGNADLSLDVPLSSQQASTAAAGTVIDVPSQSSVVLAVGSRGPASRRLAVQGVRRVLAACIDSGTRARIAAALGTGLATPADDLMANLSVTPDGKRLPAPSPSPSASPVPTPGGSPGGSPGPSSSVSASSSASPGASSSASAGPVLPPVRCARTFGVSGVTLTLLIPDTAPARAAAAIIASRLAIAGVRIRFAAPSAARYATLARTGGWDLMLAVRPVRYPAPRSVLAPLLDASWPAADAVALRTSAVFVSQLLGATAEREKKAAMAAWAAFDARLTAEAIVIPLAQLSVAYPRGSNVEQAPISPLFSNADPTNLALGSTRPGDPAPSPGATP